MPSDDVVDLDAVDIGGLEIAYRRDGEGPPLVLLHGAVCDSRVWRRQLDVFADEFTVVAWDAPGCGGSSDPPDAWRLPEYADALAGLVEALGLDRPHVVGHSFGGGLALELYRRHPSMPRSLVLAGGYAGWAGSLPTEEVETRLQLALRQAEEVPLTITPASVPGLFTTEVSDEDLAELTEIMADVRPAGLRTMARALAEADLSGLLAHIDVPVLLLYGDADKRAARSVWEPLRAEIPDSTLVLLAGIGHELFVEAPDESEAAARRFLHSIG